MHLLLDQVLIIPYTQIYIWFQNNSNIASVHLALDKLLWLTDPTLSQVKGWRNNQRIWYLVLLVETFFLRKSFTLCYGVLIFPACEPAAPPWLCPSALPVALWPPILRQVFQYWLSGSVLTSVSLGHCFAQAALFNRQKKKKNYKQAPVLFGRSCTFI